MKIEMRKLSEIKPYEQNPRVNDNAVDAVAGSIKEFGFRQPIVVDAEGVIVCGHTRWKAAQKLGLEKVPVHVARDLTPEQVRAYRIADNRLAELAEWDKNLLPLELEAIRAAGTDLSLLGFDEESLAQLLDTGVQGGQTDPDSVPEPPDTATSKCGEVYQLGNHRLMCGDSGSVADLDLLLGGAANPSGQHGPAVQRESGTEEQQRHRRRPFVLRRQRHRRPAAPLQDHARSGTRS